MIKSVLLFGTCCFIGMLNTVQANDYSSAAIDKQFWQVSDAGLLSKKLTKKINSNAATGLYFDVDINVLQQQLLTQDFTIIDLPLPDGKYVTYQLTPSRVMHPELAAKYPSIKTFSGVQLGHPENQGKFDITPQGFHGVFNLGEEKVFIDPSNRESNRHYYNYYRKDAQPIDQSELSQRLSPRKRHADGSGESLKKTTVNLATTAELVTYKLAIATTGEYAEFHGGTKETTLAALVTLVNRLNDVYQRDLAMTFELVADNDSIIFTDSSTDPFDNTDADIYVNTDVINAAIGFDNYDVGHLVGTGGGGLASFRSVCKSYKAEGVTGSSRPTSDSFYIDYVAHEIGHQFGADHTFNGTQGACEDNREFNSAYEPGSASTIMGYAGICGGQNIQNSSDPYFHIHSIDQINAFKGTLASCGIKTAMSNEVPSVDAGADYTIPAKTPFTLVGNATDADADSLSYSWEQFDLGAASASAAEDATDNGDRPLFRTFSPTNSSERTLPKLRDILTNTATYGEALPTVERALNFRLVVRDNQNNLVDDAMTVSVIAVEKAFSINDISAWNGLNQTITWHTADTENAPVSCAAVDILLSTDSGANFEHILAGGVENDGEHNVNVPNLTTDNARVKITCNDNIFFAINQADFAISSTVVPATKPVFSSQSRIVTDEDIDLTLMAEMLVFENNSSIDSLQILAGENYSFTELTITPNANFYGLVMVNMTATKDNLVSDVFQVSVDINAINDAPLAVTDSITVDQDTSDNSVDVLSNDSDVDGDTLTLKSVSTLGNGRVDIMDNKVIYTPATGFSGIETINYTVEDAEQISATAALIITVTAAPVLPEPPTPVEPTPVTPPTVTPDKTSSGSGSVYYLLILMVFSISQKIIRGKKHA
ncbi:MAG: reprolysin-like metallopeptidase [Cognaticolwellia sp.]